MARLADGIINSAALWGGNVATEIVTPANSADGAGNYPIVERNGFPSAYRTRGEAAPPLGLWNYLLRRIHSTLSDVSSMGVMEWDNTQVYAVNAMVTGGAQQYISKSASGPGTTPGAVDPTSDTIEAVWTPYPKFASDADVLDESIDDEAVSPAGLDHFRQNTDATASENGFVRFGTTYHCRYEYGPGFRPTL